MSRPTAISPEEQEQIARRIGVLLLQDAPEDWQQITVEYRATGEYHDLLGEISRQDGSADPWEPPEELLEIFEHLREGMYRPDVGTWLSALYTVERPSSYRIDINFDEEPQWQQPLPRAAYVDELRRYPRSDDNIPDWLRAKLDGSPAPESAPPRHPDDPESRAPLDVAGSPEEPTGEQPGVRAEDAVGVPETSPYPPYLGPESDGIRGESNQPPRPVIANVFAGLDAAGNPTVEGRPAVGPAEVGGLRQYLENAPVVSSSGDNRPDRLDPGRPDAVPDNWHTDGAWIWHTEVPYYLAQYGLPPEPELIEHIRSHGFSYVEIDDAVLDAAARTVHEAQTAPTEVTAPPEPDEAVAANEPEPLVETAEHSIADPVEEPSMADRPVHGEGAGISDYSVADTTTFDSVSEPEREVEGLDAPEIAEQAEPAIEVDKGVHEPEEFEPRSFDEAVAASRHGRHDDWDEDDSPDSEVIFERLRDRLAHLGITSGEFSVGERSETAWSLFDEGSDWIVSAPHGDAEPLSFARPEQASAYLLGSLLLDRVDTSDQQDHLGIVSESAAEPAAGPVGEPGAGPVAEPGAGPVGEPIADEAIEDEEAEEALPVRETPALADLPSRRDRESDEREGAGGNFLFTATEARDEPGGVQSTPGDRVEQAEQPAPESIEPPAAAQAGEAAAPPSPSTPNPQGPPPPGTGAPPPGQMPPPLPKRPPRSDQPAAPEQPPQGPAGQPPMNAPYTPGGAPPPPAPPGTEPPRSGQAPQSGPRPMNPPQGGPGRPQPPAAGAPAPGQHAPAQQAPGQQAPASQMGGGGQPSPQGGEQTIQPLRGEPPMTLYRNRQNMVIQPGTEIDRFGDPDGNVTYASRTPYSHRSLPPQWATRNYFVYRVQRPLQVLRGTAVPWFEQPGGGTAYVLPVTVNELVADGTLVALTGHDRPPME